MSPQVADCKYTGGSGRVFGLSLANCTHNRVVCTTVKEHSVAADHFKSFDRLIAINGAPVSDETVAKEYMVASGGNFQVSEHI